MVQAMVGYPWPVGPVMLFTPSETIRGGSIDQNFEIQSGIFGPRVWKKVGIFSCNIFKTNIYVISENFLLNMSFLVSKVYSLILLISAGWITGWKGQIIRILEHPMIRNSNFLWIELMGNLLMCLWLILHQTIHYCDF